MKKIRNVLIFLLLLMSHTLWANNDWFKARTNEKFIPGLTESYVFAQSNTRFDNVPEVEVSVCDNITEFKFKTQEDDYLVIELSMGSGIQKHRNTTVRKLPERNINRQNIFHSDSISTRISGGLPNGTQIKFSLVKDSKDSLPVKSTYPQVIFDVQDTRGKNKKQSC